MELDTDGSPTHALLLLLLPGAMLAGWIGIAYLFGDPVRTTTPTLSVARSLAPMSVWGAMFLAGALAITLAAMSGQLRLIAAALFIGGVIYCWWGSVFLFTAIHDPQASLVTPALHYFVGLIHFLGARGVLIRKVAAHA